MNFSDFWFMGFLFDVIITVTMANKYYVMLVTVYWLQYTANVRRDINEGFSLTEVLIYPEYVVALIITFSISILIK